MVPVRGRINARDGGINIAGQELGDPGHRLRRARRQSPGRSPQCAPIAEQPAISELKRILQPTPAETPIRLRVQGPNKTTVYELGFLINPETIASDIKGSFGPGVLAGCRLTA